MDRDTVDDAVKDLARQLVKRAAPEELAGFETQAKAWLDDPERARRGDSRRSDPLSHGLLAELTNNTPLAMYLARHFVGAAVGVAFGAAMRTTAGRLRAKWRRGSDAAPPEAITSLDATAIVNAYDGDFARIHEVARDVATEFGVEAEQAEMYARILVAILSGAELKPDETPPTSTKQRDAI